MQDKAQGLRRGGPARHLHQRLLGPPGDEAAAGGEPARGRRTTSQALDYQRKVNQVVAILGGKTPNIQNLAVGGVANAINLDNEATLNMKKLFMVKDLLDEMRPFIEQVYFVDVCAIGAMYADWLGVRRAA